jgi:hypothetical protein
MIGSLVRVLMPPFGRVFWKNVNVQVLVRMMMMRVQVLVNLDLSREEADQRSQSSQDKQAPGTYVEILLQIWREQIASKVSQHSSYHDHHCMSTGESNGKPDYTPEIMLHRHPKRGDRREVVRTDSMQQPSSENGQQ